MTKEEANKRYRELLDTVGRDSLGALFPNDFEVYMMGLELVNSDGDTEEYFLFPVMPKNISKSEPELTNLKKTAGGISILSTTTFVPETISISGDFGRTFKVLLGNTWLDFKALAIDTVKDVKSISKNRVARVLNPFSKTIKTGYGCTKILQGMLKKSVTVDDNGQPYRLYFHNPTLGEAHLVEKESFSLNMDENGSNMIWQYQMSVTTIAPIEDIRPQKRVSSLQQAMLIGKVQQGANIFAKGAKVAVVTGASKTAADIYYKGREFVQDAINSVSPVRF